MHAGNHRISSVEVCGNWDKDGKRINTRPAR